MKIVTSNRSDVFNEYIKIISNYNEKSNIKKIAGLIKLAGFAEVVSEELARAGGKAGEDVLRAGERSVAKIVAEDFTKAGVRDLAQVERIWSNIKRISDAFEGENIEFIIKKNGVWEIPTKEEIDAAKKWAADPARGGSQTIIQRDAFEDLRTGSNVEDIFNIGTVKRRNVYDAGKLLDDGAKFTGDAEKARFEDLSKKILSESDATATGGDITRTTTSRTPGERPVDTTGGATSRRPEAEPPGGRPEAEPPGGGGTDVRTSEEVSDDIARIEGRITNLTDRLAEAEARGATKAQLDTLGTSLREAMEEQGRLTEEGLATFRRESSETLTALTNDLRQAIQTGNQETIRTVEERLARFSTEVDSKITELAEKQRSFNDALTQLGEQNQAAARKHLEDLADLRRDFTELKSSTKSSLEEISRAGTATTSVARKSLISSSWNFLKKAAAVAAVIGISYVGYKWMTGDEEAAIAGSDRTSGSRLRDGGEPQTGGTSGWVKDLDNASGRAAIFDQIKTLEANNDPRAEGMLQQIARHYGSEGLYVRLPQTVIINGEKISYVFPKKIKGGRYNKARIDATTPYFIKIYNQEGEYKQITSMLENESRESDPQKIANFAFGYIAAEALFSGKGTFLGMGNRGRRFGKGKGNVAFSEFGIAGSRPIKMTKEEREALMNSADDPMSAFASGQQEFFNKISEDLNISTNKTNSYEFAKKADKISNRYFKDAVEDLQDDEFMKAYYAGFSKLHNQKPKKQKPDYEKLYDLHDESGADLIHKAHPKAISVAEAIGNGGLVENESEKSKAMEDIAFRVPSGNYRARYAFIQNSLKKKS